MMRDAYDRKRSSRSIPTGPGSRGGWSHTPEYWRVWRRNHPDYCERNRTRCIRRRLLLRVRAIAETGTDAGYSRLTPSVSVSLRRAA